MQKRFINSQLNNYKTYLMYRRQLLSLAENVFEFKGLPEFIDVSYLNAQLVINGSIAFFYDDILGLLALPYTNFGGLDVYGRPKQIQVYSNTRYNKKLNYGEFVIMYDNNGHYPLLADIIQYAERIAMNTRTSDINISQQRTPRFWKTKTENLKSIQDLVNNVDSNAETVISYDNLDLDDTTLVLEPAPFVADKIDQHQEKIWNEFLRLIGISNLSYQKKERNIKDEINAMQGGTIASRFSRFEPRQRAVQQINKKFNMNIEVSYYDGVPSTIEEPEDDKNFDMEGVDE
jgi:hypothetical protein